MGESGLRGTNTSRVRSSHLFGRRNATADSAALDVVGYDAPDAASRLAAALRQEMGTACHYGRINVVAIGSDRTTGDCLGPLVGEFLSGVGPFEVHGTLDEPVHAANMGELIPEISGFTLAVDAALGSPVGGISVRGGPLAPGAAFGRELPHVGDVAISALVCEAGSLGFERLRSVRLGFVRDVAHTIATSLAAAVGIDLLAGPAVPGRRPVQAAW